MERSGLPVRFILLLAGGQYTPRRQFCPDGINVLPAGAAW
jgi:hypothetical protein